MDNRREVLAARILGITESGEAENAVQTEIGYGVFAPIGHEDSDYMAYFTLDHTQELDPMSLVTDHGLLITPILSVSTRRIKYFAEIGAQIVDVYLFRRFVPEWDEHDKFMVVMDDIAETHAAFRNWFTSKHHYGVMGYNPPDDPPGHNSVPYWMTIKEARPLLNVYKPLISCHLDNPQSCVGLYAFPEAIEKTDQFLARALRKEVVVRWSDVFVDASYMRTFSMDFSPDCRSGFVPLPWEWNYEKTLRNEKKNRISEGEGSKRKLEFSSSSAATDDLTLPYNNDEDCELSPLLV